MDSIEPGMLGDGKVLPEVWGRSKGGIKGAVLKRYPKSDKAPDRERTGPYADYPNPCLGMENMVSPRDGSLRVLLSSGGDSGLQNSIKHPLKSPAPPGKSPASSSLRFLGMASHKLNTNKHNSIFTPDQVAIPGVVRRLSDCITSIKTVHQPSLSPAFLTEVGIADVKKQKGFEQLELSLEKLFTRLVDDQLGDKWTMLSNWVDQYYNDSDGKDMVAVCLEVLQTCYDREVSKGRKHPNPTMTSITCAITDQLLGLLERYQPESRPVLSAVRRELFGAIFVCSQSVPPDLPPPIQNITPASLTKAADRYTMRPYYVLVKEIAGKIGQAEEEIEAAEMKREKQAAVLDRGISFWQMEFQKRIMKAWKAYLDGEKRAREMQRMVDQAVLGGNTARLELENAERERTAIELEHLKTVDELKDSIRELESKTSELTEKNKKLAQQKNEAVIGHEKAVTAMSQQREENAKLTLMVEEYKQLLENTTRQCLEGPAWEVVLQEEMKDFINNETLDVNGLTKWFNMAVLKGGGSEKYIVEDFTSVLKLLDGYACILHYLSPNEITEADKQAALGEIDHYQKAVIILNQAKKLGMVFPFTVDDLINPRCIPQHVLIVSSLFQRVADPMLAASCSQPKLSGNMTGPHPLWTVKPNTPQEWKERIDAAYDRSTRWRGLGAISQTTASEVVIDKLQGRTQVLSDTMKVQMKKFSSAPVAAMNVVSLLSRNNDTREEQLDNIQGALSKNYRNLTKIFKYYASSDTRAKDAEISTDEMFKLVQDAKLKNITRDKLVEMFKKANSSEATTMKSTLNEEEYAVMLIQLANEMKAEGSVDAKLETLISKHVVGQCQYTDAEEFQERLYQKDIQDVLRVHRGFAAQVFGYYCKQGSCGQNNAKNTNSMRMDTFVDLINDLHLTDSILTHEAVRQIFLKMQVENTDMLLEFNEFLDCICAIAAFKNPAPYQPLFRRIQRFFENCVLVKLPNQEFLLHMLFSVVVVHCVVSIVEEMTWSMRPLRGTGPGRRTGCSMVGAGDEYDVMLGYDGNEVMGSMFSYNTTEQTWERREAEGVAARSGSCTWEAHGSFYIFSGGVGSSLLDDFWMLSDDTWDIITNTITPPPRVHAACFELPSSLGIYGGEGATGPLSDLWLFDLHTKTWSEVHPATSVLPPAALSHDAAYVPATLSLYIFGGITAETYQDNTMWVFNFTSSLWTALPHHTPQPSPRRGHVLKRLTPTELVLIGGWYKAVLTDIWTYNITAAAWKHEGSHPIISEGSCALPTNDGVYVYGGKNSTSRELSSAFYLVHTNKSVEVLQDNLATPPPRSNHAAVLREDRMYIFGGTDGQPCPTLFADTWMLNLETYVWRPLDGRVQPLGRYGHGAVSAYSSMLIFGGIGFRGQMSDLWEFHYVDEEWVEIKVTGSKPEARSFMGLVIVKNTLYMYGGEVDSSILMDLWAFSFETITWSRISGANSRKRGGAGPLTRAAVLPYGDGFLTVGGRGPSLHSSDRVNMYEVTTKEWTKTGLRLEHAAELLTAVMADEAGLIAVGGAAEGLMTQSAAVQYSHGDVAMSHNPNDTAWVTGLAGHTMVWYQNKLILFGGLKHSLSDEVSSTYLSNDVWVGMLPPAYPCAVGAQRQGINCVTCSAGEYYNNKQCKRCPAGTFSAKRGGVNFTVCTPCPLGSFQDQAGESSCRPCPEGEICTVGSSRPVTHLRTFEAKHSHPKSVERRTKDIHDASILILSISAGVVVVVVGVFAVCKALGSIRAWIYVDILCADKHRYPENSFIQTLPTPHGGMFSVLIIIIYAAIAASVALPSIWADQSEWGSYIPGFVSSVSITSEINATIRIVDFKGVCTVGAMCGDGISVSVVNITLLEKSRVRCSTQGFDCLVTYQCEDCRVGSTSAVSFRIDQDNFWGSTVVWSLATLSGYPGLYSENARSLEIPQDKLVRGLGFPTNVFIKATPSLYNDYYLGKSGQGYHLEYTKQALGDTVEYDTFHAKRGIALNLNIAVHESVLRVSVERYEVPVVVAAVCIGLFSGLLFLANFGMTSFELASFRENVHGRRTSSYGFLPVLLRTTVKTSKKKDPSVKIQIAEQPLLPPSSPKRLLDNPPLADYTAQVE